MSDNWSPDVRCPVLITFDIDGCSPWIGWKPKFATWPSLMSMGEYGPNVGVPRILKLLADYDIKTTFFIPAYTAEIHPDMVEAVHAAGHEIGHHNYMHEVALRLKPDDEAEIIDRSSKILEDITGQRPAGFRGPSGEISRNTLRLLKERGFRYDTSLMAHDHPYYVDSGAGPFVELPMSWVLDDFPFLGHAPLAGVHGPMVPANHVFEVWASEFDGMYEFGCPYILTMHPWIMGRPARVQMLERLIRHIRSRPGVKFYRMIDLADEFAGRVAPDKVVPLLPPKPKHELV